VKTAPVQKVDQMSSVLFNITQNTKVRSDGEITLSSFGAPVIISLGREQLESVSAWDLRQIIIRHAVQPFIAEGSSFSDTDFDIAVVEDKEGLPLCILSADETKGKVTTLNLRYINGGHPFAFAILWSDGGIKKYHYHPRDIDKETKERREESSMVFLSDCLDLFSQEEILRESEAWWCSNCKVRTCASKKLDLWMLPPVLVIHLKRFDYNSYWREKLETCVNFTVDGLDMTKWCLGPVQREKGVWYDLYAVSNHYGGMGGGHYTAYTRNLLDGRWYNFDDERVTLIDDPSSVVTSAAYVLFYVRRDLPSFEL